MHLFAAHVALAGGLCNMLLGVEREWRFWAEWRTDFVKDFVNDECLRIAGGRRMDDRTGQIYFLPGGALAQRARQFI
jgi:hypothetical protein